MSTITISALREETSRVASVIAEHATGDSISAEAEILQSEAVEHGEEPGPLGINPTWWPTDHRGMPNFRPARYHPEWHELTDDSTIMPIVILVLFGGCSIISVCASKHRIQEILIVMISRWQTGSRDSWDSNALGLPAQ
ncbi:hypothetical protein B0A52_01202 [Exophiala mesophila]|uniref:Uncharacterized protein n=1 Tax=Exophiala mesophila TaxID=212818 RepID=A0A438NGR2_EXOME|nr:hypothetical protein B0A52_01202 [Exophiala mesophila]